jgi:hypothetical protein
MQTSLSAYSQSVHDFNQQIAPYRRTTTMFLNSNTDNDDDEHIEVNNEYVKRTAVTDEHLKLFKSKTNRQLRTRELVRRHSRNASLIVL